MVTVCHSLPFALIRCAPCRDEMKPCNIIVVDVNEKPKWMHILKQTNLSTRKVYKSGRTARLSHVYVSMFDTLSLGGR